MNAQKSNPKAEFGCILAAVVAWFVLKATLAILEWTWPVWPWLAVSSVGWYLARPKTSRSSESPTGVEPGSALLRGAAEKTLACVTWGLAALMLVIILLNLASHRVSQETVRTTELWLIDFKEGLDKALKSLPLFFALIVGSLALSRLVPRFKAVARLDRLRTAATAVYVALVAATSFTLFAQAPLGNLMEQEASQTRDQLIASVNEYRALLRREQNAVSRYLAAKSIQEQLQNLDGGQRARLQQRMAELSAAGGKGISLPLSKVFACDYVGVEVTPDSTPLERLEIGLADKERCQKLSESKREDERVASSDTERQTAQEEIVRQLADADWSFDSSVADSAGAALSRELPVEANAEAEIPPEERPSSPEVLKAHIQLLKEQEQRDRSESARVESLERAASEQVTAAKMTLKQLLGSIAPGLEGLIGAYVEEAVDHLAEHVFNKALEALYRGEGRREISTSSRPISRPAPACTARPS